MSTPEPLPSSVSAADASSAAMVGSVNDVAATSAATTQPLLVDVAVATYRRTELLLPLLDKLRTHVASIDPTQALVRLVFVDNDAAGSGRDVLMNEPDVHVVVEETPGLAAARNRAMDEATDRDVLVFIDDDEEPHEGWLSRLLAEYRIRQVQAVVGAVVSVFTRDPGPWVRASDPFNRQRYRTGTVMTSAASSNLLLDLGFIREHGLRFDPRYGLTGGEDSIFTRSLVAAGGKITWCDEAVVSETVPLDRATRTWALARSERNGETWARVRIDTAEPRRRAALRTTYLTKGVGNAAVSTVRARFTRDVERRALLECRARGGIGIARGALGRFREEYDYGRQKG